MTSAFPGALDSFSTKVDGVDYYLAAHMNSVQEGVVAAQAALGQEGNSGLVEARLTLTTALPVTTGDVTGATTIYFTPFNGNRLALHNGTGWITHILTEISIAVPNTTFTMYDVFVYSNAGTPTLEALAWTNDTTRATALTTLDGVLVKAGATTRRYLGSFRTTGVSGQTRDTVAYRMLWNYYNRVNRPLSLLYAGVSHTYNVATWRPFNNSAANAQVECVIGVVQNALPLSVYGALAWAAGNSTAYIGLGVNVTNTTATIAAFLGIAGSLACFSSGSAWPRAGYNFLCPVEFSTAGGTAPTFLECQADSMVRG